MRLALTLISSMATRHLLTALADAHLQAGGSAAHIQSMGGVDATQRVLNGEAFDVVVLAADAIARLDIAGRLLPGSVRPIADSSVAVAVRAGAARPDISSAAALRATLLQARSVGYSTGPSGTALLQLFDRWGMTARLKDRLVQARAGVPVGQLVASGEAEIGFQQLSELMGLDGITLLGTMPAEVNMSSRFSGAVLINADQPCAAQSLLDFMASAVNDELKQQHGMRAVPIAH